MPAEVEVSARCIPPPSGFASSRKTTLSLGRKARAFVANLAAAALVHNTLNWRPTDIVLLDATTGEVVKTWNEHGDQAAELMRILKEDLDGMTVGDFAEKWDVQRENGP